MPVKKKEGRPSLYSREFALKICNKIACGKSLVKICQEEKISYQTILDWLCRKDEPYCEFAGMYARAKEDQADYLADQLLDISDYAESVIVGNDKSDNARVQAVRLKVDTRKWVAAKLKPRKYGDKIQHEGGDTGIKVILEDYRGNKDSTPTKTE